MSDTQAATRETGAETAAADSRVASYVATVQMAEAAGRDPQQDQSVRDEARKLIEGASKDPGLAREVNEIKTPMERQGLLAAKAEMQEEQTAERRSSFLENAQSLAERMTDPVRREQSLEAVETMRTQLEPSRDRTQDQERRDFERSHEREMEQ